MININTDKIEGAKTAIQHLKNAQEELNTAYNQLLKDGLSPANAKTICRVFIKAAYEAKNDTL